MAERDLQGAPSEQPDCVVACENEFAYALQRHEAKNNCSKTSRRAPQ